MQLHVPRHGILSSVVTTPARIFATLFAIIIALGALAHERVAAVCRFTGAVVEPCECSHAGSNAPTLPTASSQSCCEVRRVHVATLDSVASMVAGHGMVRGAAATTMPLAPSGFLTPAHTVIARQQAPPKAALYLVHRSLLI